jgi:5'-deoxynucleotidase YfbR-like HD superfamily hydrolase
VSDRVDQLWPRDALWGLLHDASEAFIADMPRPVKATLPQYRDLERRVMLAICERFGLPLTEPAIVKRADNQVLQTEARDLLGKTFAEVSEEALDSLVISPWHWRVAEKEFLHRFDRLTRKT